MYKKISILLSLTILMIFSLITVAAAGTINVMSGNVVTIGDTGGPIDTISIAETFDVQLEEDEIIELCLSPGFSWNSDNVVSILGGWGFDGMEFAFGIDPDDSGILKVYMDNQVGTTLGLIKIGSGVGGYFSVEVDDSVEFGDEVRVTVTSDKGSINTTSLVVAKYWYREFEYDFIDYEAEITGYLGAGGEVVIPDRLDGFQVTSIGEAAFLEEKNIFGISIPLAVDNIGKCAFKACTGLNGSILIPRGVDNIGEYAFEGCTGLNSIIFNSPDTMIYDREDTIPAAAKIIGYDQSTAQSYAAKYYRTFEVITSESPKIQGYACWYNQLDNAGITANARQGDEIIAATTTDAEGLFSLSLPEGTYNLELIVEGYLKIIIRNVIAGMPPVATKDDPLTMRAGDLNADGIVDLSDLGIFASVYGSNDTQFDYQTTADFNRDKIIDLSDLGYIANHYGEKDKTINY